jgi:hypothetical protein
MITRATLAYFFYCCCDYVLENIAKIFLKYFWKTLKKNFKNFSYYFIKVYVKNLAKNIIFKKNQIHLQTILLL